MKSWKLFLGAGAACAACCAIPIAGAVMALGASGSIWLAYADQLLPEALALLAASGAGLGLWWWRRRAAIKSAACGCQASCTTAGQCG